MPPQKHVSIEVHGTLAARSAAIQAQAAEIFSRLSGDPTVAERAREEESRKKESEVYRQSQMRLMKRIAEVTASIASQSEEGELAWATGAGFDLQSLDSLMRLEAEHRLLTRANRRLIERLMPAAEIEGLHASAQHLLAKASALRAEAQRRIARTAELMAEAAEFEGHIEFDPAQTLSGALIAHAEELEKQADNHRRWAAEREAKHEKTLRELDRLHSI
jgi:hypothetical protein